MLEGLLALKNHFFLSSFLISSGKRTCARLHNIFFVLFYFNLVACVQVTHKNVKVTPLGWGTKNLAMA